MGELSSEQPFLFLDDVDRMDEGTIAVVAQVMRRTATRVVMSSATDLSATSNTRLGAVVAERAPAEVPTRALGFVAMSQLAGHLLGGPTDVALVSTISARSAGNPKVASALIDAARFSGAFARVQGVWAQVKPVDDIPLDAVAHAMTALLPEEEVRALEVLSWSGPIPLAQAADVHPMAVWESLAARRRIVLAPAVDGTPTVAVSPPALGQALRARITRFRRQEIADAVPAREEVDALSVWSNLEQPGQMLTDMSVLDTDEFWQRSTELDGVVGNQSASDEAMARARWQLDPSLSHANEYLGRLLRRSKPVQVRAVLSGTEFGADDSPADLALFLLMRELWQCWSGEGQVSIEPGANATAIAAEARSTRIRVLDAIASGATADELTGRRGPTVGHPGIDGWIAVYRAATLLDAGRLTEAMSVCEDARPIHRRARNYLDGIHGEILIARNELEAAARWERSMLDRAYERLDACGIRVHACVLAEAMLYLGQPRTAWLVASAALRLGPVGPIELTFQSRMLSLGALLRAREGDVTLARRLLAELDGPLCRQRPALHSYRAVAESEVTLATNGTTDPDALWAAGEDLAREGLDYAALHHWCAMAGPLTEQQVTRLGEVIDRTPIPLLAPVVQLHEAVVQDDRELAEQALALIRPDVSFPVVATARRSITELDMRSARVRSRETFGETRDYVSTRALTTREREVAAMARSGATNREIAEELALSLRTVENHMSHILAKLDFTSRADLLRLPKL
ncbi:LuxR C-terminal-related transcriptional regulator [Cellulomonas denverensis]|uniref:LuxR C-terminal-related transcriptional regulator n=1 Tax=Cellulomonas denverensis TaxID=264297 RepID=UPI0035EA286C